MGSHSSHSAHHHKGGAGGGGSYAGSRPASGLSKRRGTFRGPPPSFYEQGGYGGTGRTAEGFAEGGFSSAGGGFGAGGGTKKKQETDPEDPTAFIDRNPLGHFNARGHFRTQTAEDARRRARRSRARAAAEEHVASSSGGGPGDFALRFLVVSGTLVVAGAMTGLLKWPTAASSGSSSSVTTSTGTGTGGKRSASTGGRGAVSGP